MADGPFPGGKQIAVITSWDNGLQSDRILHRMLNQYGYKGTFYLCPDWIGKEGYLNAEAVQSLIADGHEIGSHSLSHPHLDTLSPDELQRQVTESRTLLEARFGVEVASFAYPYGLAPGQNSLVAAARAAGYQSARTTEPVTKMTLETLRAGDPFRLPITAYFTADFMDIQMKWMEIEEEDGGIFHLWGHSTGLGDDPNDWVDFECNLGFLGGMSNAWYGTVGELMAIVRGQG